jgi:hypothetical protein
VITCERRDGAVYGQPLLIGGLAMAATGNDTVRYQASISAGLPLRSANVSDVLH